MSTRALEQIMGTAIINPCFGQDLLNGRRLEAIASFDLTADEQAMILGVRAQTLQEFAQTLEAWLSDRDVVGLPCYDYATMPFAGF